MRSLLPICFSMVSTGLVGATMGGPPKAGDAGRDAGEADRRPTSRRVALVEVEAFCSWSAWRMKIRSIALASTGLIL